MNKKIVALTTFIASLVLPLVAVAATPSQWFDDIVTRFLSLVVWPIFTAAIVIMFIFAGFLFVTANGDAAKIGTARKAVVWAVIGTVVGLLAFSFYRFIKTILGV